MVDSINGRVEKEKEKDDMSFAVDTTKPATKPVIFHSKTWPNLMAFVNGATAGFINTGSGFLFYKLMYLSNPEATHVFKFLYPNENPKAVLKRMPNDILLHSIYSATLLAPYEILRRKLEYANKGVPLSQYQGFGCAVVSGAIGAYLTTPFCLANTLLKSPNASHSRLLHDVYHRAANEGILSLWKFGGPVGYKMFAANVGTLASYKPSFDYLKDSVGLGKTSSVLGAGFVSGLFASACSYPYIHVQNTLKHMNQKYPLTGYVDCTLKIFKFGGPFAIYRGSTTYFLKLTPGITWLWFFYEELKKIDESS